MTEKIFTKEMLQHFTAAWNDHDIETIMSYMADDCTFYAVAGAELMGKTFKGYSDVKAGFQLAWQTFPDASWTEEEITIIGNKGYIECTFRGTKIDGSRVEARQIDILTFQNGKIFIKNAFRKDRPITQTPQ